MLDKEDTAQRTMSHVLSFSGLLLSSSSLKETGTKKYSITAIKSYNYEIG